jgi:peptidoglycan/LPS O-acetylase OafA/YrhL
MRAGGATNAFRCDINGLRAWAVMAVVLYHFAVSGIGGGFVGVDVFFVISGYLMFGIISSGLERGDFSVWRFYLARARRIVPALFVLCVVMLLAGWFFLMPEEYRVLGRHVRESLTFASNVRYFKESGYFDVASQEKWLLHTWSLSVEWQFYLILPLVLMLLARFLPGRRGVMGVVGALFVVSLGLCVWRSSVSPSDAFYLIQNRAWEMLAGALVYMAGQRAFSGLQRRALELLGFALVIGAIALFDKHTLWPSWRAVLPVLGSALILLAARQDSVWTDNAPAQWLGTRSYSIYLWHWPLVVALAYMDKAANPLWIAMGVIVSLLLGHLSYVWVETPAQQRLGRFTARRAGAVLVLGVAAMMVLAQQVRMTGIPKRLPETVALVDAERNNHNPRLKECLDPDKSCHYGEGATRAILIGDSHADAVVTALQAALPQAQGSVLFRGGSGCLVTFGMHNATGKRYCDKLNHDLEEEYTRYPANVPVVVVGRTSQYIGGGEPSEFRPLFNLGDDSVTVDKAFLTEFKQRYVDTMCRLAKDRPLYLVRPLPEMPASVPTRLGRAMLLGKSVEISLPLERYQARHAFVWAMQDEVASQCGAHLLDPLPYLCAQGACQGVEAGRPLYRDADHLSEFGNRALIPMFGQIFQL